MIRNHNFILLFFSRFFSVFADAMLFIILLTMLGSFNIGSIGLSLFYVFSTVPGILFSIPAGAYVERKYLQIVMGTTDIIRFLLIIALIFSHSIFASPIIIYLFLFAIITNNVFYIPANSTLLPKVIKREHIAKANSYIQVTMLIAKIGSYSIGAWLIKSGLSFQALLFIISSFYIISMIMILTVKPYHISTQKNDESNIWKDIKVGINYIKSNKLYSRLFMVFGAAWVVGSSVDLFLISYLVNILERPHEDLYLITTYSLIGIGIGSFISPYLYKKINPKIGVYLSSLVFSIVIALFSFKLPLALLLMGLIAGGFAQGLFLIFINTYLQSNIRNDYLSRIYSIYHFIYTGASLPGYLFFGYLIDFIGVINTGYIIAAYLFLVAVITMTILPSMHGNVQNQNKYIREKNYVSHTK